MILFYFVWIWSAWVYLHFSKTHHRPSALGKTWKKTPKILHIFYTASMETRHIHNPAAEILTSSASPESSKPFRASTQQPQGPKSAPENQAQCQYEHAPCALIAFPASRTPSREAGAVFGCQRETDPPRASALGRCSLPFSSTNHTTALTSLPIFNFPGTSGSLLTFSGYRYWCFLPSITQPLLAAGKFPAPGEALAAVIGIIICGWYFSSVQREVEDDLWQTKWIVSKINSTPATGMSNGKRKRGNSTAFAGERTRREERILLRILALLWNNKTWHLKKL